MFTPIRKGSDESLALFFVHTAVPCSRSQMCSGRKMATAVDVRNFSHNLNQYEENLRQNNWFLYKLVETMQK